MAKRNFDINVGDKFVFITDSGLVGLKGSIIQCSKKTMVDGRRAPQIWFSLENAVLAKNPAQESWRETGIGPYDEDATDWNFIEPYVEPRPIDEIDILWERKL